MIETGLGEETHNSEGFSLYMLMQQALDRERKPFIYFSAIKMILPILFHFRRVFYSLLSGSGLESGMALKVSEISRQMNRNIVINWKGNRN